MGKKDKKPFLPIFVDQNPILKLMTPEDIGTALLCAMDYIETGVRVDNIEGMVGMLYLTLINQYDRRAEDIENGSKGGRPQKDPWDE